MNKWSLEQFVNTYQKDFFQQLNKLVWNEDVQEGDHTTLATIPRDAVGKANLYAKDEGMLAGLEACRFIFSYFDADLKFSTPLEDGKWVKDKDQVFTVKGSVRSILTAERTVLNLIQHLSGIATKTYEWSKLLDGYETKLLDTRKTTPGLRILEKWAVGVGGAVNHRVGLYDMIMLKDNHIDYAGGMDAAIKAVKNYLASYNLALPIVVEARSLEEVKTVINYHGLSRILLDNMSITEMANAVSIIGSHCQTEASGGILANNLNAIAETGVNYISTSQLNREFKPLDLSLKIE